MPRFTCTKGVKLALYQSLDTKETLMKFLKIEPGPSHVLCEWTSFVVLEPQTSKTKPFKKVFISKGPEWIEYNTMKG